jgi:hypothetical protein
MGDFWADSCLETSSSIAAEAIIARDQSEGGPLTVSFHFILVYKLSRKQQINCLADFHFIDAAQILWPGYNLIIIAPIAYILTFDLVFYGIRNKQADNNRGGQGFFICLQ